MWEKRKESRGVGSMSVSLMPGPGYTSLTACYCGGSELRKLDPWVQSHQHVAVKNQLVLREKLSGCLQRTPLTDDGTNDGLGFLPAA